MDYIYYEIGNRSEEREYEKGKYIDSYMLKTAGKPVNISNVPISSCFFSFVSSPLYKTFKNGANRNKPIYISIYHEYPFAVKLNGLISQYSILLSSLK